MTRGSPQMRRLANHLRVADAAARAISMTGAATAFPVIETLLPKLGALMGKGGFRALLCRALALARAEVSWLCAVRVNADGVLEGWEMSRAQLTHAAFMDGRVAMLAQLLGLLEAFVGPSVMPRILDDIWPRAPGQDTALHQDFLT